METRGLWDIRRLDIFFHLDKPSSQSQRWLGITVWSQSMLPSRPVRSARNGSMPCCFLLRSGALGSKQTWFRAVLPSVLAANVKNGESPWVYCKTCCKRSCKWTSRPKTDKLRKWKISARDPWCNCLNSSFRMNHGSDEGGLQWHVQHCSTAGCSFRSFNT